MTAYYNENDAKTAAWLRELIKGGHIAKGVVDERSIEDIKPTDLAEFTQCHFFAGIGGWSYALKLAGWPDDKHVWTGSCPCQPFSAAGKGRGFTDERHLWPAWFHLIRAKRPLVIFGEQVANNLHWLDLVSSDLEAENYATGASIVGAHSVGAPHIRQRLYWVAHDNTAGRRIVGGAELQHEERAAQRNDINRCGTGVIVGNAHDARLQGRQRGDCTDELLVGTTGLDDELADAKHTKRGPLRINGQNGRDRPNMGRQKTHDKSGACGEVRDLADTDGGNTSAEREQRSGKHGFEPQNGSVGEQAPQTSAWSACDFISCTDGKTRPVEPGTFPLANGLSGRVGLLRGYGNAIVPQVAAKFIEAYQELTIEPT